MILNNVHIGNNIFKISDDAKALLDSYRNALYEHLKNFNNSGVIIKEIEYKLAELLLPYIENEFDFLTEDDVKQAILIIGLPDGYTLPDLENKSNNVEFQSNSIYEETVSTLNEKFKNLYRDIDRQQIGGVAAGIADILKIDPLWIRLLFVLPIFFLETTKVPLAFVSISYLIGWLLLLEKRNIHRDIKTKIFFRDKEYKIFGGIAAGLSNYLGMNVNWIRLGLIATTYLINELILIYAVIWIVTPYSRSLKDKFQSKGLQFNLTEIESYLTKTFENTNFSSQYINNLYTKIGNTKININPFLYKVTKGICFIIGAFLFFTTIVLVLTAIPILGISLKIIPLYSIFDYVSKDIANEVLLQFDHNLLNTLQFSIPNTTAIVSTFEFIALSVLFFVISTSLMAFRKTVSNGVLIGLLTTNFVFSVLLLTALNMSVHNFDNQASHKEEILLPLDNEPLNLKLETLGNIPLNEADIYIKSYDGKKLKMVFLQEALGKTRERAITNAKAIDYPSTIEGNSITIGSHFSFPRGVKFRMQKLKLYLYIPHLKMFTIDDNLKDKIENQDITFEHYIDDNYLFFDKTDICHSINKTEDIHHVLASFNRGSHNDPIIQQNLHTSSSPKKKDLLFKMVNMDTLHFFGNLNIKVRIDPSIEDTKITLENDLYRVKAINGILKIYPIGELSEKSDNLEVCIPNDISAIKFNGKGNIAIDYPNADSLKIELDGNINADLNLYGNLLHTILQGATVLNINGKVKKAYVFANDGSQIEGENFTIQEVKAKAKGVSKIVLTAKQSATIFQSPLSKVTILGDPLHYEKHTQR